MAMDSSCNKLVKALIIGVVLIILLVLFNTVRNLVMPGPDFSGFVSVAQSQQEMNHVLEGASKQKGLSQSANEFIIIAQLGMANDQKSVMNYLALQNIEVKPKELSAKIDTKLDAELAGASSPATYEETFRKAMKTQLTNYQKNLKSTYTSFEGEKGRAILDSSYNNSQLLVTKLETR
jgi:uncharacterized protein with von Willebrand factor type A (vWA) domain